MTSPCEKVIRRDITRTYPEHEFFKEKHGLGQESLFNVIKVEYSSKFNSIYLFDLGIFTLRSRSWVLSRYWFYCWSIIDACS